MNHIISRLIGRDDSYIEEKVDKVTGDRQSSDTTISLSVFHRGQRVLARVYAIIHTSIHAPVYNILKLRTYHFARETLV